MSRSDGFQVCHEIVVLFRDVHHRRREQGGNSRIEGESGAVQLKRRAELPSDLRLPDEGVVNHKSCTDSSVVAASVKVVEVFNIPYGIQAIRQDKVNFPS